MKNNQLNIEINSFEELSQDQQNKVGMKLSEKAKELILIHKADKRHEDFMKTEFNDLSDHEQKAYLKYREELNRNLQKEAEQEEDIQRIYKTLYEVFNGKKE